VHKAWWYPVMLSIALIAFCLEPGQELAVSRLGDKTLMIGATFVETESTRKQ